MTLLAELFGFALYAVQEAGVLLGVGAEMVLLVAYLLSLHSGTNSHERLIAATRFVERTGLGLIIASGFGAVLYQVVTWQVTVLAAPAFIGKWALIGIVLIGYKLEVIAEEQGSRWRSAAHGFIGGTWLALFLLHTLAPDTSIVPLLVGYVAWMAFFAVVWAGFIAALSPSAVATTFSIPKREPKRVEPVAPAPMPMRVAEQPAAPAPTFEIPKFSMPAMPKISLPKISLPPMPQLSLPKLPKLPAMAPIAPVAAPVTVSKAEAIEAYKVELMAPQVHAVAPAPAPKHIEPAPAPHKIVAAAPAPHKVVAAAPAPQPTQPATPPAPEQGLPAIRVMPRTPEQLSAYASI